MKKIELLILKDKMLEYLKNYGYSDNTIAAYDWNVKRLISDLPETESNHLNYEVMKSYLETTESLYKNSAISRCRYNSRKRTCRYFLEYCNTGKITFTMPKDTDLSPYFVDIISLIFSHPNWNESRKSSCRNYSRQFFKWLLSKEYNDLSSITDLLIRDYFIDCTKRMNNHSLSSTRFYLRLLFDFLYEQKIISDKFESSFLFEIPVERKIQRPTPQSEISVVFEKIDRTTTIGKRNYAMIMTAIKTGLRQCDIINLKLSDIDWKNGIVNLTQTKTGIAMTLPLTKDYGEAIIDYILNGRRKCESQYLFVSERPPFDKLNRKALYFQFNQYRKKCGMPVCSFHGLRRMLGSSMVSAGVGVDLVPDILGQSNIESIRPYIFTDASNMISCALTLDAIPDIQR